ncbi:hypothetical protein SCHPADRAFT_935147 [Schizopora paradoxa]|uniref:DUF6593 domain-containing protein n=1 Tax=Schizopora paradoxa TaxID=27342 RepID=A0A0H2SD25_9AGAM|nr:hypothetical protein SCHPADRAFT_935147 [Schizopora paradoxa]
MDDSSLFSFSTSSTVVPSSESTLTMTGTKVHSYAPASMNAPSSVVSFSTGSVNNTTVLSSSEQPLYTITTDAVSNSHTKILRGGPSLQDPTSMGVSSGGIELVAEIKRRDLLPDVIRFADWSSSRKLKSWIHGASGKASDFPTSFEWNDLKYTWKTNEARQIALYNDIRPSSPIAWFQCGSGSSRPMPGHTRTRDLLVLQPEAESILDAVLVSLVVVEQSLRWKDTLFHSSRFIPLPFVGENQTTSY